MKLEAKMANDHSAIDSLIANATLQRFQKGGQVPQQSIEDAIDHAYKRTRKLSDFFVYEISSSENKNINLVKTIRYNL